MLSLQIQEAIEARIAPLSDRSLNLNGDPFGSDSRHRTQAQHWIAYQDSSYPDTSAPSLAPSARFAQDRELNFQHYVEVEDFRRNHTRALILHETLMQALIGFRPNVEGVRGPLRLTSDGVVSAKVEGEVVYRYRASYSILCNFEALAFVPGDGEPLPTIDPAEGLTLKYAIWRSPIDRVGEPAPVSVKVTESVVVLKED